VLLQETSELAHVTLLFAKDPDNHVLGLRGRLQVALRSLERLGAGDRAARLLDPGSELLGVREVGLGKDIAIGPRGLPVAAVRPAGPVQVLLCPLSAQPGTYP
jgi:hypothetical protein